VLVSGRARAVAAGSTWRLTARRGPEEHSWRIGLSDARDSPCGQGRVGGSSWRGPATMPSNPASGSSAVRYTAQRLFTSKEGAPC
jgi:hypothetical protein